MSINHYLEPAFQIIYSSKYLGSLFYFIFNFSDTKVNDCKFCHETCVTSRVQTHIVLFEDLSKQLIKYMGQIFFVSYLTAMSYKQAELLMIAHFCESVYKWRGSKFNHFSAPHSGWYASSFILLHQGHFLNIVLHWQWIRPSISVSKEHSKNL